VATVPKSVHVDDDSALISYPYPLMNLRHWLGLVCAEITQVESWLSRFHTDSPAAEGVRQEYLDALHQCRVLLTIPLSPEQKHILAQEHAQLEADCAKQDRRRTGPCTTSARRKRAATVGV